MINYFFLCIQAFFIIISFVAFYLVMNEKNIGTNKEFILFISCAMPILLTGIFYMGELLSFLIYQLLL